MKNHLVQYLKFKAHQLIKLNIKVGLSQSKLTIYTLLLYLVVHRPSIPFHTRDQYHPLRLETRKHITLQPEAERN